MTTQSNQINNNMSDQKNSNQYNNQLNNQNIAKSPPKNFANLNDFIKGFGDSDEPEPNFSNNNIINTNPNLNNTQNYNTQNDTRFKPMFTNASLDNNQKSNVKIEYANPSYPKPILNDTHFNFNNQNNQGNQNNHMNNSNQFNKEQFNNGNINQ